MAYVQKHGKKWRIAWVNEQGGVSRKTVACPTKKEAYDLAIDKERAAERVRLGLAPRTPAGITFGDTVKQYLESNRELRSWKYIELRLRLHILPALGLKLLTEIVPADIRSLLARKAQDETLPDGTFLRKLSPQTREHLRVHIQAVFSFAIRDLKAFQGVNPASEVPKVFIPEQKPKVIPPEALPAVLAVVDAEFRNVVAAALYTGMRKGELLGQQKEDVHLEQRIIEVRGSYDDPRTKGGKSRVVPILEELVPYLKVQLGATKGDLLFPDGEGEMRKPAWKIHDIFKRALVRAGLVEYWAHLCRRRGCGVLALPELPKGRRPARCATCKRRGCGYCERQPDEASRRCPRCNMVLWRKGIPQGFSFKDLRSTFATLAYERTGDIRFVQELCGHHDPLFTAKKYARLRSEHIQQQASKLTLTAVGGRKP